MTTARIRTKTQYAPGDVEHLHWGSDRITLTIVACLEWSPLGYGTYAVEITHIDVDYFAED